MQMFIGFLLLAIGIFILVLAVQLFMIPKSFFVTEHKLIKHKKAIKEPVDGWHGKSGIRKALKKLS